MENRVRFYYATHTLTVTFKSSLVNVNSHNHDATTDSFTQCRFSLKNSTMVQPPILTRQEATLWLKVSAHSTLVMNFNSQIYSDLQTFRQPADANPPSQSRKSAVSQDSPYSRTSATSLHIIWPKPISERFRSLALSVSELRRGSQNSKK